MVHTFIAADVGNSRIKLGRFNCTRHGPPDRDPPIIRPPLPLPTSTLQLCMFDVLDRGDLAEQIRAWIDDGASASDYQPLYVASVNRAHAGWLEDAVTGTTSAFRRLTYQDMPLAVHVEAPGRVGLDRLAGAVAANALRERDRPAIVVDIGTAITVDFVSADGAFEGGAILPGIAMAARALETQTDALPKSPLAELVEPPPPVGKSTIAAIEAGLLWGAVGAIRELIERLTAASECPPHVYITGGMSPAVVPLLRSKRADVVHVPDLVLAGVALAAERSRAGAWGRSEPKPPGDAAGGAPCGSIPATPQAPPSP